ncbi:Uncharacterised protein [Mycobacteroides abscessus subsp. abscessus]|nr:Uncharacterised protein [Mycobacteroides abscessus subsp. abscessus]
MSLQRRILVLRGGPTRLDRLADGLLAYLDDVGAVAAYRHPVLGGQSLSGTQFVLYVTHRMQQ